MKNTISIIGAGAWGTALAQIIASNNQQVCLWARNDALAREINTLHENKSYLPAIPLSDKITATSNLETAAKSEILLMVTPAQALRATLKNLIPFIKENHKLVLCAKGLETGTTHMQSQIVQEILPKTTLAILSGPNFARDIASGKPAATTLACEDLKTGEHLQNALATPMFRPYLTHDIIGVQLAGALKNVIAIGCGILNGLDMGESARASLVTRGLAEIARLGEKMGAQKETFMGLSGIGDMMLTCSSEQSRNFSLGLALGKGKTLNDIMSTRKNVTEGVHTANSANKLANDYAIDLPICQTIHRCVNEALPVNAALHELLNRPLGQE